MLCSLPRSRSVVEISYGCMGRSIRQLSTASASGFDTRRRAITVLQIDYSKQSTCIRPLDVKCIRKPSTVSSVTMLPPPDFDHPDVGAFEEGTPGSRWALGRYLVGRAIGESMSRALTVFA